MTFLPAVRLAPGDRPAVAPAHRPSPAARVEIVALTVLLTLLLVARVVCVPRIAFDSDEAQHLHVAWEWTQGRIAYRDTFDNHAPLFHLLVAPFLSWIGERADIQLIARFAMFPTFAAMLLATGLLGRRLFGARVGAWAAVLLGWHAEFFEKSLEFRTDDLWVALWLLSLLVLVSGTWSLRRGFLGGLLVGVAFAVSLKTSLLFVALASAAAAARWVAPAPGGRPALRRELAGAGAVAAGAIVVPAAFVGIFAALGALEPLVACTIRHNAISLGDGGWRPWTPLFFAGAFVLAIVFGVALVRSPLPGDRRRQLTVLWAGGFAASVLLTVWPTNTPQDGMALLPTAALAVAVLATHGADFLAAAISTRVGRAAAAWVAPVVLVGFVGFSAARLAAGKPFLREGPAASVRDLDRLLRLTDVGDYVMDPKGEAIYRRRPFYFALELFTKRRMRTGLLEDRIVPRCIETSTGVVFGSQGHFPLRDRRFFLEHFLGDDRLRVAGGFLRGAAGAGPVAFDVVIPGRYAIVDPKGAARGTLDGTEYAGPRQLGAGTHEFSPAEPGSTAAFAWAKAVGRGFLPFETDGAPR